MLEPFEGLLLAPLLVLAPETAPVAVQDPPAPDARQLFLENCASCHGERGDGQGTTELDRPARSFLAGGFSFGNTPEAILRTVTYGIPGSPMPAFGATFDRAQREALASYVISLGPGLPAPPENTEMVVGRRALVVRGMLPPMTSKAVLQPRGLAIGLPSGMSFEYRTDDVRLLGLRQGRFVDRTDWVGRGGTPLEPLGQLVYSLEGGDPGPTFRLDTGDAAAFLRAEFRGTWTRAARAGLRYDLRDDSEHSIAHVNETCESVTLGVAAGFHRSFELRGLSATARLWVAPLDDGGRLWRAAAARGYRLRPDGRLELYRVTGDSGVRSDSGGALSFAVRSDAAGEARLQVTLLLTNDPAPEAETERAALAKSLFEELAR